MTVSARVDPISREVDLIISELLSPEARRATLVTFAREQLAEAQEVNRRAVGRVPTHQTFVDGRAGASIESVKPDGRLVFEFDLVRDLLVWIEEQLTRHSPVRTGKFRASHILFADGVEVASAAAAPEAGSYVFSNTQPYSRKIERAAAVFQTVAVLAQKRFGNVARIKFGFRTIAGSQRDKNTRQPAIEIDMGRPS